MLHSSRAPAIIGSVVVGVFLVANLVNTLHKGGDFDAYFAAGQRMLSQEELYAGSAIAYGFVGPPAQALLFAPLAPLGPVGSRLVWYGINVVLLWYALATWVCVLSASHAARTGGARSSSDEPAWRAGTRQLLSSWAFLPILAIAAPLQTQFEHQNLNIVLLALAAFGVDALTRGRAIAGGAALGVAAAIKVYPVLPLGWLALRHRWRAFGAGVVAAVLVTAAPVALRGLDRFVADLADWHALAGSGWPTRRANQSLLAMWGRYLLGEGPDGYPNLTLDQPWVLGLAALTAIVMIVPLARILWRVPSRSVSSSSSARFALSEPSAPSALSAPSTSASTLPEELACVNAVAILVSPIAWEHYWVAFFPPLVALLLRARDADAATHGTATAARDQAAASRARWAKITFWIAFVCLTVLSRSIIGWYGARLVRAWSLMTWAGVLACVTLATLIASRDSSS